MEENKFPIYRFQATWGIKKTTRIIAQGIA